MSSKIVVLVFLFVCLVGGGWFLPETTAGRRQALLRRRLSHKIPATGEFTLTADSSSFVLTPNGNNCNLQVSGSAALTGTVEGVATGTTHAKVFATCDEVGTSPPGSIRDIFQSDLQFEGTIDGVDAMADITYRGKTAAGGVIEDAQFKFSNGAIGLLTVDAVVLVGGTYEGEFTKVG